MRPTAFLLLTVLAAPELAAQRVAMSHMASPRRVVLRDSSVTVPLRKIGDFYYADASVNGRAYLFTLETGAGFAAVSPRLVSQLGLAVDTVEVFPGQRAPLVRIDSIVVGGASYYGVVARVLPTLEGSQEDGLISIPLLRELLWTLDLSRGRLVLTRGALPEPDGREVVSIPGRDRGRRVDMPVAVGGDVLPAVLDTRYAGWIVISDSLIPRLSLAGPLLQAGTAWGPSQGTFEMRGARLAGNAMVGMHTLAQPALVFRDRPGPIVGIALLEQFTITVDQKNARIRLQRPSMDAVVVPAQSWETAAVTLRSGDRTFGFRMAVRPTAGLRIVQLVPGSAAEKAGIRDGDEVVEFDGTPAAAMSPDIFRAALSRGGPIKVVVQRDGRRHEFAVESYVLAHAAQQPNSAVAVALAEVERTLHARAAADSFSGAVIVARNGVPFLRAGHGLADRETKRLIDPDTKFNLGSIDKLITRIALWQLVAAGKLHLDATVGTYLPDYPNAEVRDRVTVRQLYTMRSGVGDFYNHEYSRRHAQIRTVDDYLSLFAREPLQFDPGTSMRYSNGGYIILGKIIERITNENYYDYVLTHITGPTGMTATRHYLLDDTVANRATGYTVSRGTLEPNTFSLAARGSPAGGGYSTVNDFLKLDAALRSGRLIPGAYADSILPPAFRTGGSEPLYYGGGGPGTNTGYVSFPDGWTIIVFTNNDPSGATETVRTLAGAIGKTIPAGRQVRRPGG